MIKQNTEPFEDLKRVLEEGQVGTINTMKMARVHTESEIEEFSDVEDAESEEGVLMVEQTNNRMTCYAPGKWIKISIWEKRINNNGDQKDGK